MLDQKQPENVKYFSYLGSMIAYNERCPREIKSMMAMAKAAFKKKKKTLVTSKLDLKLKNKLVNCYIWNIALYGAETWTLQKVDHKYLEVLTCAAEGWRRSVGQIM